jgi:CBS domain-containing protein
MTTDIKIMNPSETVQMAAKAMADLDVGLLPVSSDDRLVGVISDRDIAVRAVAQGKGPDTPIEEAMTPGVHYCFVDEELDDVCQNMGDLQIRRLPVLSRDKRLVGIVSLGDVARDGWNAAGEALEEISKPGKLHTQM